MRELTMDELNLVSGGDSGNASSAASMGDATGSSVFLLSNFLAGSGVSFDTSLGGIWQDITQFLQKEGPAIASSATGSAIGWVVGGPFGFGFNVLGKILAPQPAY